MVDVDAKLFKTEKWKADKLKILENEFLIWNRMYFTNIIINLD